MWRLFHSFRFSFAILPLLFWLSRCGVFGVFVMQLATPNKTNGNETKKKCSKRTLSQVNVLSLVHLLFGWFFNLPAVFSSLCNRIVRSKCAHLCVVFHTHDKEIKIYSKISNDDKTFCHFEISESDQIYLQRGKWRSAMIHETEETKY